MMCFQRACAAFCLSLLGLLAATPGWAQKSGGILKIEHFDSPASMSILEEATRAAEEPAMSVFNNLVIYDQHVAQNSMQSIVPDLALRWSWSEDGKALTFPLHQGVKWHDGKPFTSADVKCTWDLLMGISTDRLRVNPRKSWYSNVDSVTPNGDFEVTFHLKRPQPSLLALLASGWAPIYPCHVPAREMRLHPIGTGPFKFVEFKPNEHVTVRRNPDYWKPGRPYLDGIDFTIMREIAPRDLAFYAGNFDVGSPYGVTPPTLADFKAQAPKAICQVTPVNVPRTMLINPHKPPFDNPQLRRAMTLAVDRGAFSAIINGGERLIGTTMLPPPAGVWGMPPEMLQTLPGYDPDTKKSLAEARKIMVSLGYGPDKPLVTKVSTRDIPSWRDPAVLLASQLKEIYIDAELDIVDTTQWYPKIMRRDYAIGAVPMETGVDDPDQMFYENFYTGATRNYAGYSDPEFDKLVDRQSVETDVEKRKQIVWQLERKLADAAIRPVLFYPVAASCWQPYVKGLTIMVNSIYNGWRMEDVWLDK
ncbi:MAG TPA: ABC transporter substrate-binding protein [Stellaceae bacterium]|jgi:peptide/nickel transport system substrate-binding protein|nr:ABC transporter substrate-binding protein [Stellaceae bacterium]